MKIMIFHLGRPRLRLAGPGSGLGLAAGAGAAPYELTRFTGKSSESSTPWLDSDRNTDVLFKFGCLLCFK